MTFRWTSHKGPTFINGEAIPMERYEIKKRCILLVLALFALSGCGGDDPTEPAPGGASGLVFSDFQEAALVIGQLDMSGKNSNLGGVVGPIGLNFPQAISTGFPLFVTDDGNHRVLGFNEFPKGNGQPADFVVGQDDLTSGRSGTTAGKLKDPMNAVTAVGKLFVADWGNKRILIWNTIPSSNAPADVVVGQLDFTTVPPPGATEPTAGSFVPIQVEVSGGKLFVADQANNRVLIWNTIPTNNGAQADVVVGQTDFTSNSPGLSVISLKSIAGIWVGASKLVISDGGNRRLLIYNSIPTVNGAPADFVVGAPDFVTVGNRFTPDSTNIGGPAGVTSDGTNLFVADAKFHRVLIFAFPTVNGATPTGILGQSNFFLGEDNDSDQNGSSDPTASGRTLHTPHGLSIIEKKLIVTDFNNHRLLVFESK